MNWLTAGLGILLSAILAGQGFICVSRRNRLTWAGVLSLLLAAIGLFFSFALPSGAVVISTEFGIVMVQGEWSTFLLGAAIFAISICGGLLWLTTRAALHLRIGWKLATTIWSLSALIGALSVIQFSILEENPHLTGPLAVRYYGMWFPLPMIWLIVCLSESVLTLTQTTNRLDYLWYPALLVTPVGLYGLGWQEISDPLTSNPYSRAAWLMLVWVSFSAAIGLSVLRVLPAGRRRLAERWRRWIAAASYLATAAILGYLFQSYAVEDYREELMAAFAVLAAIEAGLAIRRGYRVERAARLRYKPRREQIAPVAYKFWQKRGDASGSAEQDWHQAIEHLRARQTMGRLANYIISFLICAVAAVLFDLHYFSAFSAGIDLLLGFVAWFFLIEFLSGGAFARIPLWTRDLWKKTSAWTPSVLQWFRKRPSGSVPPAKEAAKEQASSAGGSGWVKTLSYGFKVIFVLAFIMAVSEAFHHGSTEIVPFTNPDADEHKERPGEELAKLLVDQLSLVGQEVPELIVVSNTAGGPREKKRPGEGQSEGPRSNLTIASEGNTLSAIPGTNEIDLFGLKIPLGVVAAVVQEPIRYLFNIEEIKGGIYKERNGKQPGWRAIATSSRGKVWSTDFVPVCPAADDGKKQDADSAQRNELCDPETASGSPVQTLAHQLAVRIIIDQPASGMTHSEDAFAYFERGLALLKDFDNTGNRASVQGAISSLQRAVSIDNDFADGFYRLAQAFEKVGQPIRAAETFRAIPSDKTNSIKALVRRANIGSNLRSSYDDLPAAVPPIRDWPSPDGETVQLWYQVAEHPDASALQLHEAYLGICNALSDEQQQAYIGNAYFEATRRGPKFTLLSEGERVKQLERIADEALRDTPRTLGYLPYYFCKRAEAVYAAVPEANRNDPDADLVEASVLNQLGNIIGLHNRKTQRFHFRLPRFWARWYDDISARLFPDPVTGWTPDPELFCDAGAPDVLSLDLDESGVRHPLALQSWGNAINHYAIPYYLAAHILAPGDTTIACNYATTVLFALGDTGPAQSLGQDVKQRLAIGDNLSQMAHEFAWGIHFDALHSGPDTPEKQAETDARGFELGRGYYSLALKNYVAAYNLNETSIASISKAASCIWHWWIDARKFGFSGPDPTDLDAAVNKVGKALQYSPPKEDVNDIVNLTTMLVELKIAQGKADEAVKALETLKEKIGKPEELDSALFYLIDIAHAYTCAHVAPSDKSQHQLLATEAWAKIKAMEDKTEFRPITGRPDEFTQKNFGDLCFQAPAAP